MNISTVIKKVLIFSENKFEILATKSQCGETNKQSHESLFCLTLLMIFSVIFFLNYKTIMTGDDYGYSFIFETSQRVSSIGDIVESQSRHYVGWGGRIVVHFIAQSLLFINSPMTIDIINSIAFVAFVYFIYLHITGDRRVYDFSLLLIVFSLLWLLQPTFAETTLWITGSANYLWGSLIILMFLLPYRLYKNKSAAKSTNNIAFAVPMLLGGVIAGWTNENTAAGMIAIIVGFLLYYKYKKWNLPVWVYSGLLGAIIGYVIMIAAPGNFVRAAETSISPFLIVYRTLMATQNFVYYLGVLNLGVVVLLILYSKFYKEKNKSILPYILIYTVGLFISIYIMAASPGFPPRTWFGPITFNIILFGIVLYNQDYTQSFLRQIKLSLLLFCLISFGFTFYDAYGDISAIDKIWKERIAVIEQQKQAGATSVTFTEYQAKTKFGLGDAPYAKKFMSDYYGIELELEE